MKPITKLKALARDIERLQTKAYWAYIKCIQELVDKRQMILATGQLSDMWQLSKDGGKHFDYPEHIDKRFAKALERIDAVAQEIRVGPSNMEMFKPRKRRKR